MRMIAGNFPQKQGKWENDLFIFSVNWEECELDVLNKDGTLLEALPMTNIINSVYTVEDEGTPCEVCFMKTGFVKIVPLK